MLPSSPWTMFVLFRAGSVPSYNSRHHPACCGLYLQRWPYQVIGLLHNQMQQQLNCRKLVLDSHILQRCCCKSNMYCRDNNVFLPGLHLFINKVTWISQYPDSTVQPLGFTVFTYLGCWWKPGRRKGKVHFDGSYESIHLLFTAF